MKIEARTMPTDRIIFHIDMDAFFASIEIARNPALKGKPVIVGGNPDSLGVVSTCSYEARKFGVHSAMSLYEAKLRCPEGIFLQGNYSLYQEYSREIIDIFMRYTPYVEVLSIDEAYLDVSEVAPSYWGGKALGELLKKVIYQETKLSCSIGIASSKHVAKIASSLAKPNGVYEVPAGQEKAFLAPLPIQTLAGVGTKTQETLNRDGIQRIADIQKIDVDQLIRQYGGLGFYLHQESMGIDNRPVVWEDQPPKSIGAETTFEKDQSEKKIILGVLQELAQKAHLRLKRHQMRARGLTLKLRYSDFQTINRSHTLFSHSNKLETFFNEAVYLLEESWDEKTPLRLIGISLEKLTNGYWQPTLWDWEE
jgi:DNA polymerase IV